MVSNFEKDFTTSAYETSVPQIFTSFTPIQASVKLAISSAQSSNNCTTMYPSLRKCGSQRQCSLDYAVDLLVDGVKSHSNNSPLLHLEFQPVLEFRGYDTKYLSTKNTISEL